MAGAALALAVPVLAQVHSAARPAAAARTQASAADAAGRLRKSGLALGDPALAAKLRANAARSSAVYVQGRTLHAQLSPPPGSPQGGTAAHATRIHAGGDPHRAFRVGRPTAVIRMAWDGKGRLLWSAPQVIDPEQPLGIPGTYYFAVESTKPFPPALQSQDNLAVAKLETACTPPIAFPNFQTWVPSASTRTGMGIELGIRDASRPNLAYIGVNFRTIPVPGNTPARLALAAGEVVTEPLAVTLAPSLMTAVVAVTVSHAPAMTGIGTLAPWGGTGLSTANANLGSPSVPRVGGGDWQQQTAGDDLLGFGLALKPGWRVLSAAVKNASSAADPNDLTPENAWRGAKITTPQTPNDLRVGVHWHYSGIDSLDYTVEWTLLGPMGQRPLSTMQKLNSCEN